MNVVKKILMVLAMAGLCGFGARAQDRGPGVPPGSPHTPVAPVGPGGADGPAGPGMQGVPVGPGGAHAAPSKAGKRSPRGVTPGEPRGRSHDGAEERSRGGGQPSASATATRGVLRLGPAGRWWDDSSVVRNVGLSREQQRRMDSIFDANKAAIVSSYTALEGEKAKLAKLTSGAQVDQKVVFAEIDAVSQARTALEKATTQMLLGIRGEMKPEQLEKLETVQ